MEQLAYTDNIGDIELRVITQLEDEGFIGYESSDVPDIEDVLTYLHIVNDGIFFHEIIGEITGQSGEEKSIYSNSYDWSLPYGGYY